MAESLFDLSGRIALVSGASRGIGESIARLLAKHGALVIVSSRKGEDCERVAASIVGDGGAAEAYPCHVGRMEDIAAIFEHIRATHGRLDICVNNAATNPIFRSCARYRPRRFHQDRRGSTSAATFSCPLRRAS